MLVRLRIRIYWIHRACSEKLLVLLDRRGPRELFCLHSLEFARVSARQKFPHAQLFTTQIALGEHCLTLELISSQFRLSGVHLKKNPRGQGPDKVIHSSGTALGSQVIP